MDDTFRATTAQGRGGAVIVRVEGRLDAKTAPRLLEHCRAARHTGGHLVLNLSGVTFLSSSGVGVLLVLSENARLDGGSLRVAAPSAAVRAPLELLNLHRFLVIDGSEDEAVSSPGA